MASGTIAQQITRLHPDDSGFAAALEKQVEQYPYCSLTHLLLLKATPADDPQFASRAAKTQLHVQQPFLLQFPEELTVWRWRCLLMNMQPLMA